ncbi:class I SAM-dependent RNA methyltransferase [Paradevosia shaoguanensis]|uniref:class I SAM-dependent RNA methyltransferase n=1 Tax=Paradevosia shaoguanensis TaxID=1335043 RepID=UPI003C76559C
MMTEVTISGLGARGEGIAEVAGQKVFVPFTLPGEVAEVDVTGDHARLERLIAASEDRIEPFCPHFGACGGCQLQHLGLATYRTFKRGLVETALRRAGIDTPVGELIDAQGAGRRRATLHARREGSGYMQARSHEVHDLDRCPILVPALAKATDICRALQQAIGECDVSFTATRTGLDVAIRAEKARAKPERLAPITQQFRIGRLSLNGEMLLLNQVPAVAMGKAMVEVPVGSFLQATEEAETVLAGLVLEPLAKAKVKSVADLFCGIGPFTLRMAEIAKVYAADSDKPGIAALQKAVRNTQGLKAVTAQVRDLFREPLTQFELGGYDAIVFDPPRAGAEAQAKELAKGKVKTIVGVSCEPKTFARDAVILIAGGYRLESVVPVDQFAWSTHVELVGVFRR